MDSKANHIELLNQYLAKRDTRGFLAQLQVYIKKFHSIRDVAKQLTLSPQALEKLLTGQLNIKKTHLNMILDVIDLKLFFEMNQNYEEVE